MNYVKAIINSRMLMTNGRNLINYPVNITRTDDLDTSSSFIELEVSTIVQDDGVEELHCALLNEYVLFCLLGTYINLIHIYTYYRIIKQYFKFIPHY